MYVLSCAKQYHWQVLVFVMFASRKVYVVAALSKSLDKGDISRGKVIWEGEGDGGRGR